MFGYDQCPVCGSDEIETLFESLENPNIPATTPLLERNCLICGWLSLATQPTFQDAQNW